MDSIRPAQLSFLTIYNPSLGKTEETTHDQIVYYYSSKSGRARQERQAATLNEHERQNAERNERMRQIGLAQGMVGFARAFSDDESIDLVDTEKARFVMKELEPGWWMLAEVDLTRIMTGPQTQPKASFSKASKERTKEADKSAGPAAIEYSSRELSPQYLLLQQFLRAHAIVLLHHGASLSDFYARRGRHRFCATLDRFWNRFVRQWDVLMCGSPATDVFNGLKLAAGGELGIGVGEEEWGSGERDVLERLVRSTEGLVDMVVSRFGEPPANGLKPTTGRLGGESDQWLGSDMLPLASDGVVFSGVGAISREATRKISAWMEWIARYGLAAYGCQESPHSMRRKHQRSKRPSLERYGSSTGKRRTPLARSPGPTTPMRTRIPPSLVTSPSGNKNLEVPDNQAAEDEAGRSFFDTDTMMKYMTLGIYGSSWGIPSGRQDATAVAGMAQEPAAITEQDQRQVTSAAEMLKSVDPRSLEDQAERQAKAGPDVVRGCFVIGLQGDLHDEALSDSDTDAEPPTSPQDLGASTGPGTATDESASIRSESTQARRIQLRTLYVERATSFSLAAERASSSPGGSRQRNIQSIVDRLRVVVYVQQPFVYTFLFDPSRQPGLALPRFYRKLAAELASHHAAIARVTSPADVRRRLWEAAATARTEDALASKTAPVYDLVYDPANLTCHTTLPNIPDQGHHHADSARSVTAAPTAADAQPQWSRSDALAVHALILRTWHDTRRRTSELERTMRTNRGWCVVWMRLPGAPRPAGAEVKRAGEHGDAESDADEPGGLRSRQQASGLFREAFLVRKTPEKGAGGAVAATTTTTAGARAGSFFFGRSRNSGSGKKVEDESLRGSWGPARLVEGIGIDTRRYIEGLLSLNR